LTQTAICRINSSAPTRICDNGGWTDTWFAEHGEVFHIAIEPRAEVQVTPYPLGALPGRVVIAAENYGETYIRELGMPWQKHPLIEAAIDHAGIPESLSLEVNIHSDAPPGASIGTSAAVTVALIGALDALSDRRLPLEEIALQAHQVETDKLGGESGVQDQLAAAFGGINLIEMDRFPHARVTPIRPDARTRLDLQSRLVLVCLGLPHKSSQVHREIVAHLGGSGPDDPRLERLRRTARPAAAALLAGDFKTLGQTFIENTEAQRGLHPDLINPEAQRIIEIAREFSALGWKVNGAGGEGGSVALLMDGSARDLQGFLRAVEGVGGMTVLRPKLAEDGLRRLRTDF
jgi:D-glycero-alpha-D-manno-heptose-7-phosphate kinase